MMTSPILKFVNPSKINSSTYLEEETLIFLQIEKFIHYTSRTVIWPKNSAKVIFKDGPPFIFLTK